MMKRMLLNPRFVCQVIFKYPLRLAVLFLDFFDGVAALLLLKEGNVERGRNRNRDIDRNRKGGKRI